MDIKPKFEVSGRIARPVSDVFEAFVNPDSLSRYFTTGGAVGRIEQGATVTWDFQDFPGVSGNAGKPYFAAPWFFFKLNRCLICHFYSKFLNSDVFIFSTSFLTFWL